MAKMSNAEPHIPQKSSTQKTKLLNLQSTKFVSPLIPSYFCGSFLTSVIQKCLG